MKSVKWICKLAKVFKITLKRKVFTTPSQLIKRHVTHFCINFLHDYYSTGWPLILKKFLKVFEIHVLGLFLVLQQAEATKNVLISKTTLKTYCKDDLDVLLFKQLRLWQKLFSL